MDTLSAREIEVAALLCGGLTYDEVASRLCISFSTVKGHANSIYRKTGTRNKTKLLLLLGKDRESSLWHGHACSSMIPEESPCTNEVFMYIPGQQFTDGQQDYVLERSGSDEYGAFAVLEWNDVPKEMQRQYEVPPAMIVRNGDRSHLQAI